jgi:hypothetical protein
MLPDEKGKHCLICDKTVVDFSSMSNEEIKSYLLQNAGQKTCGRFRKSQLEDQKNSLQMALVHLHSSAQSNIKTKSVRLIILLILGGMMTLTGCSNEKEKENKKEETETHVMGMIPTPSGLQDSITISDSVSPELKRYHKSKKND